MPLSNEFYLVCMIDDDQEDQAFFSMALQRIELPHKLVCANSGPEAIELFQSHPHFIPDIIFLDINMPVMNGLECLEELRKMTRLLSVPIYTYSTSNDERTAQEALRDGATGTLQKLSSIQDLAEMLRGIFSRHYEPSI